MPLLCAAELVAGYKLKSATPGQQPVTPVQPAPGQAPPEAEECPRGFFFDGSKPGVYACERCTGGSTTQELGATSAAQCRE